MELNHKQNKINMKTVLQVWEVWTGDQGKEVESQEHTGTSSLCLCNNYPVRASLTSNKNKTRGLYYAKHILLQSSGEGMKTEDKAAPECIYFNFMRWIKR